MTSCHVVTSAVPFLQTLNLDSSSNLWVAGAAGVTRVNTESAMPGSTAIPNAAALDGSAGVVVFATGIPTVAPDVVTNIATKLAAACTADTSSCCDDGNLDGGITITRDATCTTPSTDNTVYVANTCETGLVRPPSLERIRMCMLHIMPI